MSQFKKGDVVQLKSGGPKMTVASVEGENVVCTWFDEGTLRKERFDGELLDSYDDALVF